MSWLGPRKPGIPIEVKGNCNVCGRQATVKSRIDPTHPGGGQKTLEDIALEEVVILATPITHAKCATEDADQ